ncbi:MAG TPA: aminotransferase class V-fold PLP-dependent enzyme [Gemmatimonadales bacterium]|nr:aminotransferase class V-fold PLP-dependent enzyme [Gemmatimonadales bacterium]
MSFSRRDLLAAAVAFPGAGWLAGCAAAAAGPGAPAPEAELPPLPPFRDDEAWWRELRRRFYLADGIFMNTGTFGASPRAVVDATVRHLTAFETVFHQQPLDEGKLLRDLGALLGAPAECLALTRNTTEAMNVVARGLDLGPQDTVVSTTHEHVGGICPWQLVTKRYGARLVTFTPPLDPASPQELVDAWVAASPPGTRVWMISHVLFSTGLIQPVQALCAEAKRRGIITAIDGAHPPGMLQVDLTALGCDFYASSPHKWLLAPKGTGFLYISPEWIDRLWPLCASGGWDDLSLKGMRFDHVGTRNDSLVAGFQAALDFHAVMGAAAIERRTRGLATLLDARLRALPGITMHSPARPEFRSAMVSFTVDGHATPDVARQLWQMGPVRVRQVGEYGYNFLRLSTHIYNGPDQVERVVGMLEEIGR